MSDIAIGINVKTSDNSAAVHRAVRAGLHRSGQNLAMRVAAIAKEKTGRSSTSIAAAGQPPARHIGTLWDHIEFTAGSFSELSSDAPFYAGPIPYNSNAAGLIERGGTVIRRRRNGRPYLAHYAPHPYMGPSLAEAVAESGHTLGYAQLLSGLSLSQLNSGPMVERSFLSGMGDGPNGVIAG